MTTPGSLYSVIPRTRNSMATRVLPHPAGPQMSVDRDRGRPPPVTSSRPLIPVGVFCSVAIETADPWIFVSVMQSPALSLGCEPRGPDGETSRRKRRREVKLPPCVATTAAGPGAPVAVVGVNPQVGRV